MLYQNAKQEIRYLSILHDVSKVRECHFLRRSYSTRTTRSTITGNHHPVVIQRSYISYEPTEVFGSSYVVSSITNEHGFIPTFFFSRKMTNPLTMHNFKTASYSIL